MRAARMTAAPCGRGRGRALPLLIAVTDPLRLADPIAALARLPRGTALIWRAYGEHTDGARLRAVAREARRRGVLLLVAGDTRLSARPGPGGLHLPERMIKSPHTNEVHARGRRPKPGFIVTAAAHGETAIRAAARAGADAVLISPVFATASHPGAPALGAVRFAQLARLAAALGLAPYALGGVTDTGALRRLKGTGIAGAAGIGFIGYEP